MGTDLLIIRHGQSTWNALRRWQGHSDPPLSELGRRQAEAAATRLDRTFDAYVASDLQRALHTAEFIAAGSGHVVEADAAFRERCAGEWEGLTRVQIDERWPDWQSHPWRPDGWEGDTELLARVIPALDALVQRLSGLTSPSVLLVTHVGVVRALDRHCGAESIAIPNLAGRWFHYDQDWQAGEFVALVEDVTDSKVE